MNILKYRKLKPELLEKFNNQCVYCGTKLLEPLMADVEHFYPKSLYPDLVLETENLLIACKACSIMKANKFPIDEDGKPLLIHPAKEDFSEHIIQLDNGYLEGKTERGEVTIDTLQLNRESLIKQRVLDVIDMEFDKNMQLSNDEIYETFQNNIEHIKMLNLLGLEEDENLKKYIKYMLYSNVITTLETYLCDRFVFLVQSNNKHLRNFVQSFHGFKNQKFSINEIFIEYDEIKNKSNNAMKDVLYHDLPKVSGMYRDTFGIKFPEFSKVYKSINIRHDLVHRNGKTKEGDFHTIDKDLIIQVIENCMDFVNLLEEELKQVE